jgi:hypothetical protein
MTVTAPIVLAGAQAYFARNTFIGHQTTNIATVQAWRRY